MGGATAGVLLRRRWDGAVPLAGVGMSRWALRQRAATMSSPTRRRLLAARRPAMPRPPLGRRIGASSGEQMSTNRREQLRQILRNLSFQLPPPLRTAGAVVGRTLAPPSSPALVRPARVPPALGVANRLTFPALLRPCVPCRLPFQRRRGLSSKCPKGGSWLSWVVTQRLRLPLLRWLLQRWRQWRRLQRPRSARGGRQSLTPLSRQRRLCRRCRHRCPPRCVLGGRTAPSPMCTLRRRRLLLRLRRGELGCRGKLPTRLLLRHLCCALRRPAMRPWVSHQPLPLGMLVAVSVAVSVSGPLPQQSRVPPRHPLWAGGTRAAPLLHLPRPSVPPALPPLPRRGPAPVVAGRPVFAAWPQRLPTSVGLVHGRCHRRCRRWRGGRKRRGALRLVGDVRRPQRRGALPAGWPAGGCHHRHRSWLVALPAVAGLV